MDAWIAPLIVIAHISDPTTRAHDCATDLATIGAKAQWRTIEIKAGVGSRRVTCGSFRDTTPAAFAAIEWSPSRRR